MCQGSRLVEFAEMLNFKNCKTKTVIDPAVLMVELMGISDFYVGCLLKFRYGKSKTLPILNAVFCEYLCVNRA